MVYLVFGVVYLVFWGCVFSIIDGVFGILGLCIWHLRVLYLVFLMVYFVFGFVCSVFLMV